jgi:hypothetical protein
MSTSQLSGRLRENPGADFIAAFILALIVVALVYPFDREVADKITNFAFLSLVAGVALQILGLRTERKDLPEKETARVQPEKRPASVGSETARDAHIRQGSRSSVLASK